MKKLMMCVMLWMVCSLVFGQSSQNQTTWSLYSGSWNMFLAEEDSAQADATFIDAPADTFWSRPFFGWPIAGIHMFVTDTAATGDSVNFVVNLYQYGYTYSHPDTAKSIFVKTLSWRSTTSSTPTTTISAKGYYGANITDTAILPFRWFYLQYITATGHTLKRGNVSARPVVNVYSGR